MSWRDDEPVESSMKLCSSDDVDEALAPSRRPPERRMRLCDGDWRSAIPPRDASSARDRAADVSRGSCGGMACERNKAQ